MNEITIYRPGSIVQIGPTDEPITVTVLKACIENSPPAVSYEVSWYNGQERKTAWVQECEVHMKCPENKRIGFHESA